MRSPIGFVLLLATMFTSPAVMVRAGMAEAGENALTWDDTEKTVVFDEAVRVAEIVFTASNQGPEPVTVLAVRPSCDCTAVRTPALPWTLNSDESGQIVVSLDLTGKMGEFEKTIAIETTAGEQSLLVRIMRAAPLTPTERRAFNQRRAWIDRQAIFRGGCARCHSPSESTLSGAELYERVCAICHEAAHRAAQVPVLGASADRDAAYWRNWIIEGRSQTMMPAFARDRGGVLSVDQIDRLVEFLLARFPAGSRL